MRLLLLMTASRSTAPIDIEYDCINSWKLAAKMSIAWTFTNYCPVLSDRANAITLHFHNQLLTRSRLSRSKTLHRAGGWRECLVVGDSVVAAWDVDFILQQYIMHISIILPVNVTSDTILVKWGRSFGDDIDNLCTSRSPRPKSWRSRSTVILDMLWWDLP